MPTLISLMSRVGVVAVVLTALWAMPASARDRVLVAVAANFAEVLAELEPLFEAEEKGADLVVTVGSTGKLYAQINSGAPFDVLLSADQDRPARLEAEGRAAPGSRFTYAIGRLTLWSPDAARIGADGPAAMSDPDTRFIAMANPRLAPYGAAAEEALEFLGVGADLRAKLVMGQNVGQAFSMVATGNAEVGLVALSAVLSPRNPHPGSRWDIPLAAYTPIRQDAVLLSPDNASARAFMDLLKSDAARAVIRRFGYGVE